MMKSIALTLLLFMATVCAEDVLWVPIIQTEKASYFAEYHSIKFIQDRFVEVWERAVFKEPPFSDAKSLRRFDCEKNSVQIISMSLFQNGEYVGSRSNDPEILYPPPDSVDAEKMKRFCGILMLDRKQKQQTQKPQQNEKLDRPRLMM